MRTDYLVVGAGASGLSFVDALVARADVEVTIVDRRDGVGGHWGDAYPFVRLHSPSAYYGVDSLALGEDRIDEDGFYERATGPEVRAYFDAVAERLASTGKVRFLGVHEHLGAEDGMEVLRDLHSGELRSVEVRRRVVDARYLEASVPATHRPTFTADPGARVVPVNHLPEVLEPSATYAVLGAGKTAIDACLWLLDHGVGQDRIRWVRPRDAWFWDRAQFQPLAQIGANIEGLALDAEAAAEADDFEGLLDRLEDTGRLIRLDPSEPAEMFRGTLLSADEVEALRRIDDVVRLGRVRRITADRIVMERGEMSSRPGTVHVDCTAHGLNDAPAQPIFQPGRIVLQMIRQLSPTFNAALVGFVEARGGEDTDRNRLCPPNPYPSSIGDWPGMTARTWAATARWRSDREVSAWIARSRLNLLAALPDHLHEPAVQDAARRYAANVGPALERLSRLAQDPGPSRTPIAIGGLS